MYRLVLNRYCWRLFLTSTVDHNCACLLQVWAARVIEEVRDPRSSIEGYTVIVLPNVSYMFGDAWRA